MTSDGSVGSQSARADASDIAVGSWVERMLPAALVPYAHLARLDRPIGTWLLLFPCWWGLALAWAADPAAANAWSLAGWAALFAIGAAAMRGAGCTYNDLVDRGIDGRVARTALRPIPSGRITPRQALVFLALQLAIGAIVLFSLPTAAIWVGLCSLPLVALYPWMKRVTYWPQVFLGLAFNWGILIAWATVTGGLDLPAILLYAAAVAWTLGYDTIYAHQDREDDALVGVKSTALLFGSRTRPWLWGFYATTLALMAASGLTAGLGWILLTGLIPVALQLGWQAARVNFDDPHDCLHKFRSNRWTGWLFAGACLAAGLTAI